MNGLRCARHAGGRASNWASSVVVGCACGCAVALAGVAGASPNSEACDGVERVRDAEVMAGKCRSKRVGAQGAFAVRVCVAESARSQLITALGLADVVGSEAGDLLAEFRRQRVQ